MQDALNMFWDGYDFSTSGILLSTIIDLSSADRDINIGDPIEVFLGIETAVSGAAVTSIEARVNAAAVLGGSGPSSWTLTSGAMMGSSGDINVTGFWDTPGEFALIMPRKCLRYLQVQVYPTGGAALTAGIVNCKIQKAGTTPNRLGGYPSA